MDIQKLKERKKALNLSYDELAEKSGIPKTTLTNIFLGITKNPRLDTVEAIEKALGLYSSPKIQKDPALLDEVELQDYYPIPLLGSVVAGVPSAVAKTRVSRYSAHFAAHIRHAIGRSGDPAEN